MLQEIRRELGISLIRDQEVQLSKVTTVVCWSGGIVFADESGLNLSDTNYFLTGEKEMRKMW